MLTISVGLWLCGGCSGTDVDWFILADPGHGRLGSSDELLCLGAAIDGGGWSSRGRWGALLAMFGSVELLRRVRLLLHIAACQDKPTGLSAGPLIHERAQGPSRLVKPPWGPWWMRCPVGAIVHGWMHAAPTRARTTGAASPG